MVPHPQFRDEEPEVQSGHYMPDVEEETMSDDFQLGIKFANVQFQNVKSQLSGK